VVDLTFSPETVDGVFLLTAAKDHTPMLRDGVTGDWIGTFTGHKGAVWGVAVDSVALLTATASADYTAKLWDAVTGKEIHSWEHPKVARSVSFAHDRSRLATACNDKLLRIFDLQNYTSAPSVVSGHTAEIKKVMWAPDDVTLLSASEDKTVRRWDVRTQQEAQRVEVGAAVTSMSLSADSETLVTTHAKTISFWHFPTLTLIKSLDVATAVNSASLHPDNHMFVWGGDDFAMHVVNYETMQQTEQHKAHFGPVHCVQFSPDGEIYVSGSEDGTARLWQTTVGKEYGLWKSTKTEGVADPSLA